MRTNRIIVSFLVSEFSIAMCLLLIIFLIFRKDTGFQYKIVLNLLIHFWFVNI
jgi:hypothetical protein